MLGVLLMALEDFQTGLQQRLKLTIIGRRNESLLKRPVDGLVVGDLVLDIGSIERRPIELAQVFQLGLCLARQGRARRIASGVTPSFFASASA